MKKQLKKLTLNKETLRDLTALNAGEVKGGSVAGGCSFFCTVTRVKHCTRLYSLKGNCH
jgi:hypothetical protein